MQIVIDIPEDLYEGIERRDGALEAEYVCDELMKAVDNGIPLPKGHGKLKDTDVVIKNAEKWGKNNPNEYIRHRNTDIVAILQDEPTIIEADKAEGIDKE